MAKSYIPATWVDEELIGDPRYNILENGGDPIQEEVRITLINDVAEPGTSLTAARMNNIEAGIDSIDTILRAVATSKTVSGGALTVDQSRHKIQPETGTADDIDTISGIEADTILILFAADHGTDTLTFKHGTGNISCFGGADINLSEGMVVAYYDGTTVFISGGGGGGAADLNEIYSMTASA